MKKIMPAIVLLILLGAWPTSALIIIAATPSPTPSPTPTLTNSQIIANSTINPPYICGQDNYIPCGPVPFPIPRMPTLALPSPTQIDINAEVVLPTTGPGTPTLTATATLPSTGDISTLSSQVIGISNTLAAQSTQQFLIDGTPNSAVSLAATAGANAGVFFASARGLQLLAFYQTGRAISFLLMALGFILFVKLAETILPLMLNLIRLILQVLQVFKPF